MEDRRPGPEETTDQDNETTPKKRRGGDFLSQYLLRRREQSGEKPEEDEEETEEKPKKFRRFFRGLFKNVVQPPEQTNKAHPTRLGLDALFITGPENAEHNENDLKAPEIPETSEHAYLTGETTSTKEQKLPYNQPAGDLDAHALKDTEVTEDAQEYVLPNKDIENPISVFPEPESTAHIDRTLQRDPSRERGHY
jgi:hypothetical protein